MPLFNHRYIASDNTDVHPRDFYPTRVHQQNRTLVAGFLDVLGVEGTKVHRLEWGTSGTRTISSDTAVTPWMISGDGLVRVLRTGPMYQVELVNTGERIENGVLYSHGIAEHLVKHTIKLDEDGLEAETKIYPPFLQELRLRSGFHQEGGASMDYPTLNFDPGRATEEINFRLSDPGGLLPATDEYIQAATVHKLLAQRPITARLRLGVRLPN